MKKYRFVYPYGYGEEKIYFDDGDGNDVIFEAEDDEKAMYDFIAWVSREWEEIARSCYPEEVTQ